MKALVIHNGMPVGHISETGNTEVPLLGIIADQILRGVAKRQARNLQCFPEGRDDPITLAEFLSNPQPDTPDDDVSQPSSTRLDWEAHRERIAGWVRDGLSITDIAGKLGVKKSTLAMANKRYGLYQVTKRGRNSRLNVGTRPSDSFPGHISPPTYHKEGVKNAHEIEHSFSGVGL